MSNAKTIERFKAKTKLGDGGCIEWTAYTDRKMGYGMFWLDGTMHLSHRVAYMFAHGSIPKGLHVCHSCDNPKCVNPEHLWVGTNQDNVNDKCRKNRAARLIGENHPSAKLKEDDVLMIRSSKLNGAEIARRMGIDRSTVNYIRKGKLWGHLK